MILDTAKKHFDEDIARARSLHDHAKSVSKRDLQDDIFRSSWMMAVGACDAYFCDAYADLIARVLQAKNKQPGVEIPDRLNNLKLPVIAVLRQTEGGWRWRMAARELVEKENVLSLKKIKELFNCFFPKNVGVFSDSTVDTWIIRRDAKYRLFGMNSTKFRKNKQKLRRRAKEKFSQHFEGIFQRRHDCIHNCDRPKEGLQPISERKVNATLEDIEFLVLRCHERFCSGFPDYLDTLKVNGQIKWSVLQ